MTILKHNSLAVNGAPAGSKLDANAKYSAYVSPYYVENGSGTKSGAFSKHYYAGSDRIASKTADDAYFYFTDHLGSTTHITGRSGDVAQYAAYTPYGSLFREYRSVQPYKFNGKELDQETGYYYYGARYYDPTTTLWLGTDPLKHKYPDIGAYVYCAGNPVKYVDLDGRAPWDNSNIRRADRMAGSLGSGYSVERTQGKFGEDAHVVHISSDGTKSFMQTFTATKENQRSAISNFDTWLSNEAGRADPANNGTVTNQDIAVATGTIGVLTGGVSLAIGGSTLATIITVVSIMNSIDDMGTNKTGESMIFSHVSNEDAKQNILLTKNVVTLLSSVYNVKNIVVISTSTSSKTVDAISLINNIAGSVNNFTNDK